MAHRGVEHVLGVGAVHAEEGVHAESGETLDDSLDDSLGDRRLGPAHRPMLARNRSMVRSASAVMVSEGLTSPTAPGQKAPSTTNRLS